MFELFRKQKKRLNIQGTDVFINNTKENIGEATEIAHIFGLSQPIPEIKVYQDEKLVNAYKIETLYSNPDLTGQYLHSSIRILPNGAVMIDGIISKNESSFSKWTDKDYEAVRLQPFFLSYANNNNIGLIGKGLFDRGMHFTGTVTPTAVRCVCICDNCKHSFTLQHFHAGFSEVQYFYSTGSKETLIVPYNAIVNMPRQLQKTVDLSSLAIVESNLPQSSDGSFRYYNSFNCPHCSTAFIDFNKHREIRPNEYYGNTLLNHKPKQWTDLNSR